MNPNTLLADPSVIRIDKFVSDTDSITIFARSIQKQAYCPLCGESSSSLKSRYFRKIADLPWHDVAIRLKLKARKFRCLNLLCGRKVFCEPLPKVVTHYARRTIRLTKALSYLAFMLGGCGGAKAASRLNLSAVDKDKLLRLTRSRLLNDSSREMPPVKVLGVDDFAFRKGCTYGTILVDLEKRKVIDLLPDRESAILKSWLEKHPEIESVSRDRSFVYAEAVRSGAPQAEQDADRWHLLKNLSETVEKILLGNQSILKAAWRETREQFRKNF